jgi:hypothetical protein
MLSWTFSDFSTLSRFSVTIYLGTRVYNIRSVVCEDCYYEMVSNRLAINGIKKQQYLLQLGTPDKLHVLCPYISNVARSESKISSSGHSISLWQGTYRLWKVTSTMLRYSINAKDCSNLGETLLASSLASNSFASCVRTSTPFNDLRI